MGEIFLTSDLHINHDKDFLWGARGFTNVKEMNEAIVENWNKVVRPEDTVWNLGDIALSDTAGAIPYLKALNGTQYWLLGNHDHHNRVKAICDECPNIIVPKHTFVTKIRQGNILIYLGHYPMLTSNYDADKPFERHVFNMHGHTHQTTNWHNLDDPFMYHVGVDSHNFTPITLDNAINDIHEFWKIWKATRHD